MLSRSPAPPSVVATASSRAVRALLWGDADTLSGSARGGNDAIRPTATGDGVLEVYGDGTLIDRALGGNDTIRTNGSVVVYGDGLALTTRGGDDVIVAKGEGATIFGDALIPSGGRCGNDRITVNGDADAVSGDGQYLGHGSLGGNDRIVVSGHASAVYGDAGIYLGLGGIGAVDGSRGGNDVLINKSTTGIVMIGDATLLHDATHGGNDTLIGGCGGDTLRGDAESVYSGSTCGNDVSGRRQGRRCALGRRRDVRRRRHARCGPVRVRRRQRP